MVSCLTACVGDGGGGGGSGGGMGFAPFEGIYQITSYTQNTAGCDVEGASVLADHAPMLASVQIRFLIAMLTLHPCEDLADCQAVTADVRANNVFPIDGFTFSSVTRSGDGAGGTTTFVGTGSSTTECTGSVTEHTLTRGTDGSIHIESRATSMFTYPEESGGFCTTDDAKKAAAGLPCSEFTVLHATPIGNP